MKGNLYIKFIEVILFRKRERLSLSREISEIWGRRDMRDKKKINFKALILGIAVFTVIVIVVTIDSLIKFII